MFQPNMFETTHHHHHHLMDISHNKSISESDQLGLGANLRDDDLETKSGTELIMEADPSGDDELDPTQKSKRKRYHRHTQRQIQEMEASALTQMTSRERSLAAQHERHENSILKAENDKLRAENNRYKEALSNATCPNCGGPAALGEMSFDEQHLRIENARLREEIDRISGIAAKYAGKPLSSFSHLSSHASRTLDISGVGNFGSQSGFVGEMFGATGDLLRSVSVPTEADKPIIVELAVAAMEELIRMAQAGDPLWIPAHHDNNSISGGNNSTEILNEDEYLRTFPRGIGPKPLGMKSEASRETNVVIMNHTNLVEILMDVNQWSTIFCGIVSRAMTLDILSTGVAGNYNGALQVLSSKSLHHLFQRGRITSLGTVNNMAMELGQWLMFPWTIYAQVPFPGAEEGHLVTWVEHVEVDDRAVHNIYKPLVNSGIAFGAKRWVATLDRQCERLASSMASNIPAGDLCVITSPDGRKSMLKLAERMVMSFCVGVGASTAHAWTTLSATGSDDVRVMTRKSMDDPGRPPGIVLSAATSFWLPVPPKRVFDFLRDENSRSEWDILSNGGLVQEMAHIANGRDPGNCVSLLRVNSANSSQSNMLILQESCTDSTGSYVIYAPVDIVAMNVVGSGGSLLTVAFQILVDSVPTAKLSLGSVATVNNLIKCTVERIRAAVTSENVQ
ncbi:hypothetical protein CsatA_021703 [Cannabis sativa]